MRKKLSPLDVYPFLSGINCKECGEESCLGFATRLVNREVSLDKCPKLLLSENVETYAKLRELLSPPVREVVIGVGERTVKIGGKLAVYRHDGGFVNPCAFAVDVSDELSEKELVARVKRVEGFGFDYIGQVLRLDLVAVRCTSNSAERFRWAVEVVRKSCELPLVLCSLDVKVLEAGLSVTSGEKPLLCAANVDNWKEIGDVASRFGCALVVSGGGDLAVLRGLVDSLLRMGVNDLVLDVGTSAGDGLAGTLDRFVILRRLACDAGDALSGFPLLGAPLNVWLEKDSSGVSNDILRWREAYVAGMMLTRSADLLVMHSVEGWALLPLVVLRQNLYIDPRKPVAVSAGLREFGCVGTDVPVLLTTNFALTYFTVASDLEKGGVNAYLLVVDTGGIAVDSSVAGRRLTAEKIANAVKVSGVEGKVKHRKLVIPGKASRLANDIEKLSGWNVVVGPKDSSDIAKFLQEKWLT